MGKRVHTEPLKRVLLPIVAAVLGLFLYSCATPGEIGKKATSPAPPAPASADTQRTPERTMIAQVDTGRSIGGAAEPSAPAGNAGPSLGPPRPPAVLGEAPSAELAPPKASGASEPVPELLPLPLFPAPPPADAGGSGSGGASGMPNNGSTPGKAATPGGGGGSGPGAARQEGQGRPAPGNGALPLPGVSAAPSVSTTPSVSTVPPAASSLPPAAHRPADSGSPSVSAAPSAAASPSASARPVAPGSAPPSTRPSASTSSPAAGSTGGAGASTTKSSVPASPPVVASVPATSGGAGANVAVSETVHGVLGQNLTVSFPGDGWIYLGTSDGSSAVSFVNKKVMDGKSEFVFRVTRPGDFTLLFQRQNLQTGDQEERNIALDIVPPQADFGGRTPRGTALGGGEPMTIAQAQSGAGQPAPQQRSNGAAGAAGSPSAGVNGMQQAASGPQGPSDSASGTAAAGTGTSGGGAPATGVQPAAVNQPPAANAAAAPGSSGGGQSGAGQSNGAQSGTGAQTPGAPAAGGQQGSAGAPGTAPSGSPGATQSETSAPGTSSPQSAAGSGTQPQPTGASAGPAAGAGSAGPSAGSAGATGSSGGSTQPSFDVNTAEGLLAAAKYNLSQGRPEEAERLLTEYIDRYSYTDSADEAYFLLAQLYEQNAKVRNIEKSLQYYTMLRNDYPLSSYWEAAGKQIQYLTRHFIYVR